LRDDKHTGDLGNAIAATQIRGRRLGSVIAWKSSLRKFGVLQHIPSVSRHYRRVSARRVSADIVANVRN